jgi:hypothetical protein
VEYLTSGPARRNGQAWQTWWSRSKMERYRATLLPPALIERTLASFFGRWSAAIRTLRSLTANFTTGALLSSGSWTTNGWRLPNIGL